jgi:hypothetical protein
MYDLFFSQGAAWYTIPAIVGTGFFTLRMLLLMAGSGHHLGVDFHSDVHAGDLHGDADASDSTHSFQILSIQTIAAFVMGFGWAGLAGLKGTHWDPVMVNLVAIGCGAGMVWLLGLLLRGMTEMQTSGTIQIASAVGREGDVYVTVPGDGARRGQVRVTVESRQRIYDAISKGEDLPTGSRVRVLHANDDNTLTVGRA